LSIYKMQAPGHGCHLRVGRTRGLLDLASSVSLARLKEIELYAEYGLTLTALGVR